MLEDMTHEWRNWGVGIAVLVLAAGGAGFHYWFTNEKTAEAPQETGQVAGESDESASFPDGTPVTRTVKLNETLSLAGVKINPTEIAEDSRCPEGVQCIQAGTVRVGAVVTARGDDASKAQPVMFALGVPMTVGLDQITLVEVTPVAKADTKINPIDYVFTFTVVKGAGTEFFKG